MTGSRKTAEFSQEESDSVLKKSISAHLGQDTAALALITTYNPAKITPTKKAIAQIGLVEELGVEDAITEIKNEDINKLFLLVNSFGGGVSSSFKIARAIRENFDDITVFIPHIAASGGTLIALTGNRIVMGDMSNLSPIDVQIERKGNVFSANAMIRAFHALNEMFSKTSEDDAPYPWKAMANKLDPVEFQEWLDATKLMEQHAGDILQHEKSSFRDKSTGIIDNLSKNYPTHRYTITYTEAKMVLGEDICFKSTCETYKDIWKSMNSWLRAYITKEAGSHIIRYVLPEKAKSETEDKIACQEV